MALSLADNNSRGIQRSLLSSFAGLREITIELSLLGVEMRPWELPFVEMESSLEGRGLTVLLLSKLNT